MRLSAPRGLALLLVLSAAPSRVGAAPGRAPLRWNAPRGNAGKSPPRGAEWPRFNGKLTPAQLSDAQKAPHRAFVPLLVNKPSGRGAPGSSVEAQLLGLGVQSSLAKRAAAHAALGLPSQATHTSDEDLLVARKDAVISYSTTHRGPNWVSWTTDAEHLGQNGRSDDAWRADPSLPKGVAISTFHDYEGAGYDPGHMLPSADRTANRRANARTYLTSNTVPQSFNVNRGPWAKLEQYTRDYVRWGGKRAHVIAGPVYGAKPLTVGAGLPVPSATWKLVVLLDKGKTVADIDAKTPIIAVMMPNHDGEVAQGEPFTKFQVTPAEIERATGLRFFDALPKPLADTLRQRKDTPPQAPSQPKPQN